MAFTVALKLLLSAVSITAVAVPVSYLVAGGALGAFEKVTYVNGERCLHFPIKTGEVNKKLYVCKKKGKEEPIFKWWVKGEQETKIEEIKSLSWKRKEGDSSGWANTKFELEVELLNSQMGNPVKEDGDSNFLTGVEITELNKNCYFKSVSNEIFILNCKDTTRTQDNSIHTFSIRSGNRMEHLLSSN
ncbi:hypothetical protein WEN_02345 [Mycoplasma wenyonii str. Massachusetts]|uniref:Uncharacterized protein n=1 Tax=Mycoplasma wenyonii (strain Massachusetts) TaxID=1197325 RepID=I6YBB3_MYCWM|nr:hypothetical protein [Mycoplasma wenyonii]AFN65256.1 hypothetical protein WEN_02345 [Mycoplasma wenyonii str. Massachusetts]